MDLADFSGHRHPKYRYALLVVDRFFKYLWVRPLRSKRSSEIAKEVGSWGPACCRPAAALLPPVPACLQRCRPAAALRPASRCTMPAL